MTAAVVAAPSSSLTSLHCHMASAVDNTRPTNPAASSLILALPHNIKSEASVSSDMIDEESFFLRDWIRISKSTGSE